LKAGKKLPGDFFHNPLKGEEAQKGEAWFVLNWQARERKLFNLGGEVAAKLTLK
jgi:hypothetical protein